MAHLRIDGREFSTNELFSWVEGFLALYRQGRLRSVRIPKELRDILKMCGEEEPSGDVHHSYLSGFLSDFYEKIRCVVEKRIDEKIGKMERQVLETEKPPKEGVIDVSPEKELPVETKTHEIVDTSEKEKEIRRGVRKHSTVFLYRTEFEKHKGRSPDVQRLDKYPEKINAAPDQADPGEDRTAHDAGFLTEAALEFLRKISSRLHEHDVPGGLAERDRDTHGEPVDSSIEVNTERKRKRELSDKLIKYLRENEGFIDRFIEIVQEGITELAVEKCENR